MKRSALSVAVAFVSLLAAAPAASAIAYEPEPSFCKPALLRDHLEPLERLPKLPAPPRSGRLAFGPTSLRLEPLPALITGEGRVGYRLYLQRQGASVHPRWTVTTTLVRVDWQGRLVKTIARATRKVRTIDARRGAGVEFDLSGAFGPYRVLSVFRSKAGEKLGSYGFYFRLVRPDESARLALNSRSYRPGQTVFARVDNFGTALVTYGVPYAIEQLSGSTWSKAPESPKGPWILPLYFSEPGMSGDCTGFWIPPSMPAGRYRMVKQIDYALERTKDRTKFLTAEFDVVAP
jgi:hypothetical protein